nr:hypothetical protein [Streptomyces boluensis]
MAVLLAAVALTASLPLAGALAGPTGPSVEPAPGGDGGVQDDAKQSGSRPAQPSAGQSPAEQHPAEGPEKADGGLLSGLGLTTAARCGPELASPGGVEAQTCVLEQSGDIWARTYYRNATAGRLSSVLTLMGPEGRTVQIHCAVGADDEPGACETPREPARGAASAYSAIAEFAAPEGSAGEDQERPLLLRSGSNSARTPGS